MGTELPRREGDKIRIPDIIMGQAGERGETSRLIGPHDGEWRQWDRYLTSSATISPQATKEQ